MKQLTLAFILFLSSNAGFSQSESDSLFNNSLKFIFDRVVMIDSIINFPDSTGNIQVIQDDGNWGYDATYYYKNQIIKYSYAESTDSGLFETNKYMNLDNNSSLQIFTYSKNGILNFKYYLIKINSNYYDLPIFGNKTEFVDKIERFKNK